MSKREDYLKPCDRFMLSAALISQRSKDPSTQVGAVIVNDDQRIVAEGYNGMCNGISDDAGLWGKGNADPTKNKYMYVVHAEANAIVRAEMSCKGFTMYCTHFPCHECAKLIIQKGIKRIVYTKSWGHDKDTGAVSRYLLETCGVEIIKYEGASLLELDIVKLLM
jgi:dCMP deaminase